ncbi:MAG TPA: hypothetical protein VID27_14810, partial [Blastocatellia bacterium]
MLKRFIKVAAALLILFVVCYVALYLKATSAEEEVERAWAKTFIDLDSLPAQFPPGDKNATALMLEEMFKPGGSLGLDGGESGYGFRPPWKNGWDIFETRMRTEAADRIPEDARRYFETHQSDLLNLYKQIQREPPSWEIDIEKFPVSPTPSLALQQAILRLFLLDAMNKSASGRSKEALEALEAAWTANRSLRNRPEAVTQIMAMM